MDAAGEQEAHFIGDGPVDDKCSSTGASALASPPGRDEQSSGRTVLHCLSLGHPIKMVERQFAIVKGQWHALLPSIKGCSCVAQWLVLCAFLYSTSDRSSHLHLLATLHQPGRRLEETHRNSHAYISQV